MISIDIQAHEAGKATVTATHAYSTLRISDGAHNLTFFFDPEAADKLKEAAKLINEAFRPDLGFIEHEATPVARFFRLPTDAIQAAE